jgi:hypothetical protein
MAPNKPKSSGVESTGAAWRSGEQVEADFIIRRDSEKADFGLFEIRL